MRSAIPLLGLSILLLRYEAPRPTEPAAHGWPVIMTKAEGSGESCVRSALLFVHETKGQLSIYDGAERILLVAVPTAVDGSVDAKAYSTVLRGHINIEMPPGQGPRVLDIINLARGGCHYRMDPYQTLPRGDH
jgi:hypothetical protein